jgi:chemotaxis protein methyltransferase CheR
VDQEQAVQQLLIALHERTGVDFRGYRQGTVQRRITNRMLLAGISDIADYLALVKRSNAEAARLIERLTIKVSRFYRNPSTFELLRTTVMPALKARRTAVRVWSAGCGRGEEPYTLAMLLDEADADGWVVASDIDPYALRSAGQARYGEEALADLPADLARRYLLPCKDGKRPAHAVVDSVRARVRFECQDLTSPDALPGGSFDLVCCRNVLIYLQPAVQQRVVERLRSRLVDGGFLCLGESEWPPAAVSPTLVALDGKNRIFRAFGRGRRPCE